MHDGSLDTIRRFLAGKTETFACYRLPDETDATLLAGKPEIVEEICGRGFAIAPFCRTEGCPTVMIRPERMAVCRLSADEQPFVVEICPENRPEERKAYAAGFEKCKQALASGKLKKVVYARRHVISLPASGKDALCAGFLRACRLYPRNYVALWCTPQTGTWLTASPELLVRTTEKDGRTSGATMALAGTLGATDGQLPAPGAWDEKNRAEQHLVTQYIMERLAGCCTDIQAVGPRPVRSGNVVHLCTSVSFRCGKADAGVIARRLHPTPAICGLPSAEAAAVLAEAENDPRRYYAGYSGPCGICDGQTHLYVSLRCLEAESTQATLYAGGGLLPESTETAEWEETQKKLAAILAVVGI